MVTGYQPYTVADVRKAAGSNGFTMAGSFSGGGGSSIGYSLAGWDVRWANEFDPHAVASYRAMFPTTQVDDRSITEVTADDILPYFDGKPPDLWEGSPPCSKFSTLGRREKSWNQTTGSDSTIQQANVEDLFFQWVRLLGELQPRVAVAENVVAMRRGAAKGKLVETIRQIQAMGYHATIWELDASAYGVPQVRHRLFVVAWHPDRANKPVIPSATRTRETAATASQAFEGLGTQTDLRLVTPGTKSYWRAQQLVPGSKNYRRHSVLRIHPDRPGPCISANGRPIHWDDPPRWLSGPELRRLQSFPEDYPWPPGTAYTQKVNRLGNSVPPFLARAVGQSVAAALTG